MQLKSFDDFTELIKKRQEYDKDTTILVVGPKGSGKSTFCLQFALNFKNLKYLEEIYEFLETNVCFEFNKEFIKRYMSSTNDVFILDEGIDFLYRYDFMSRKQKIFIKFLHQNRFFRNVLLINIQNIELLSSIVDNSDIQFVVYTERPYAHILVKMPFGWEFDVLLRRLKKAFFYTTTDIASFILRLRNYLYTIKYADLNYEIKSEYDALRAQYIQNVFEKYMQKLEE